jgi:hypothetical protein
MRRPKFVGVAFILFALVAIIAAGFITSGLWNLLMPEMFHLPTIGFWQALGLLFLSRLLFGRSGGWTRRMRRSRFVRGWSDLTPEERERFRRAMGSQTPPPFDAGDGAQQKV